MTQLGATPFASISKNKSWCLYVTTFGVRPARGNFKFAYFAQSINEAAVAYDTKFTLTIAEPRWTIFKYLHNQSKFS